MRRLSEPDVYIAECAIALGRRRIYTCDQAFALRRLQDESWHGASVFQKYLISR